MNGRLLSPALLIASSLGLSACSWFSDDSNPATAASGDRAQVTPAGQAAAPGAAATTGAGTHAYGATGYPAPGTAAPAPAAPIANEVLVVHTILPGDSLWKLSRQYNTSVQRIKEVNGLTTDDIFAGKTINIPTTNPPAGAITVPAPAAPRAPVAPTTPAAPTTTTTIPSATNPVVQPLPATTTTPSPAREPIAIPRPGNP